MAENPENQPVDLDAPTEKVVKQALADLPTWEEWLQKHGFTLGMANKYAWSDAEWNREWPSAGRGWMLKIHPQRHVITIDVYNNWLRWGRSLGLQFFVNERTLPKVVGALIKEIERNVSDHTRKRRIKLLHQQTPSDTRVEPQEPGGFNGPPQPVRVERGNDPHPWVEFHNESIPRSKPIPDDPTSLTPEQMDDLVSRVRVTCLPKGQRVRIRMSQNTRLNGMMGTVVDAGPHACYVALDDYVQAGDDDPFRFEEQEMEPVYENRQEPDLDAPAPYLAALDYITPLTSLGYQKFPSLYMKPGATQGVSYRKSLQGEPYGGVIRLIVTPDDELPAATIYIDYRSEGELVRIQDITVAAIEIVDAVRDIEALAFSEGIKGISDFADALRAKGYPGTPIPPHDHLYYLFGESLMEPDDVDNPQPYFDQLQRHADVINEFRRNGVRMRRRMAADRPYYEMFYIPSAVTDVSYDIFLEPADDGNWDVSARGEKTFEDEKHGDFPEEFDIDQTWEVKAGEDIAGQVDDILHELRRHKGPDEPTYWGPDVDDIDESEEEIGDYAAYAASSGGYNPVMLLTSKDIRKIVRELGFKMGTLYRSRRTHGWTMNLSPATGPAFELFQKNPHHMAEYVKHELRQGIMRRLPTLANVERSVYVIDDKLIINAWEWSGASSSDPSNPNNWTIYADILPIDHDQRLRGGRVAEGVDDPDDIQDLTSYAKGAADPVKALEENGYRYGKYNEAGTPRWNKFWPLPQPLTPLVKWAPTYTKLWGSPDIHGQYVYGFTAENRPAKTGYIVVKPLNRKAGKDDWDIVTSIRRVLLRVEELARNLPNTNDLDTVWDYVDTGMQKIKDDVNTEADTTWNESVHEKSPVHEAVNTPDPVNVPDEKPEDFEDDVDLSAYAKTTFDPVQFLHAAGWKFHSDQAWEYYAKTFPTPRPYQLGGMTFTGIQVRIGIAKTLFDTTNIGVYFVDDKDIGMGIQGYDLRSQRLNAVADEYEVDKEENHDPNMSIRRFALGIGDVLASIAWPDSGAALAASSKVNVEVGRFIRELNQRSQVSLREGVEDVDPERYVRNLGTIDHVMALHGLSKMYRSEDEGGWMRTFKYTQPAYFTMDDAERGATGITELRLVVGSKKQVDPINQQPVYDVRMFVRIPASAGEVVGSRVIWGTSEVFKQEHEAARALNTAVTHAIQTLKDDHERHNLTTMRQILQMGVGPFLKNEDVP